MGSRIRKLEENLQIAEEEADHNKETIRKLLDDIDRSKKYVASTDILKEVRTRYFKKLFVLMHC